MTDSSPAGAAASDAGVLPSAPDQPGPERAGEESPAPQARDSGRFRRFIDFVTTANPFVVSLLSFVTALIVGAILIVIANRDVMSQFGYFFAQPSTALSGAGEAIWSAYSNLFKGALFDPATVRGAINGDNTWGVALHPISETLTYATPLMFTGLAVAYAFRGGLFNIGAQGQAVLGAIVAAILGFSLDLPGVVMIPVVLIGAALAGGLWGFVPGVLKARTGAHEVIVTIMLNYIAANFLLWIINQHGVHDPSRSDAISKTVRDSARLPKILGPQDSVLLRTHLGLVVAVLAAAAVAWLINRSTVGFELRAVGLNPDASRAAGMSVPRTYATTMVVSGVLAGLGGASQLLGTAFALTSQVMGNIGFDGITVALLGRAKPWGVVVAALLFGGLYAGGNQMQSQANVTVDLVNVLQAVIVLFIAAPGLIKAMYRLREDPNARLATTLAKGW